MAADHKDRLPKTTVTRFRPSLIALSGHFEPPRIVRIIGRSQEQPGNRAIIRQPHSPPPETELPPGDHPLEIAARKGFGPMCGNAPEAWHGGAIPCVSCGQLVRRGQRECEECGQDLAPETLARMTTHAGPWFVFEHLRPFPGVSLERIVRQIRRGLITPTSIIRGPSTYYQWRFAAETPGLCRYFQVCWNCQSSVASTDAQCRACGSYLSFEGPHGQPPAPGNRPAAVQLAPDAPALAPPIAGVGKAGEVDLSKYTAPSAGVTAAIPLAARGGADGSLFDELRTGGIPAQPSILELTAAISAAEFDTPPAEPLESTGLSGRAVIWIAAATVALLLIVLLALGQWRSGKRTVPAADSPMTTAQSINEPSDTAMPSGPQ